MKEYKVLGKVELLKEFTIKLSDHLFNLDFNKEIIKYFETDIINKKLFEESFSNVNTTILSIEENKKLNSELKLGDMWYVSYDNPDVFLIKIINIIDNKILEYQYDHTPITYRRIVNSVNFISKYEFIANQQVSTELSMDEICESLKKTVRKNKQFDNSFEFSRLSAQKHEPYSQRYNLEIENE